MSTTALEAPRHQRVVIVTAVVAAVAGALMVTPTIATQFWIALAPIAFFGLAHGGADPWLVHRLARTDRRTALTWFAAYMALATGFVGVILWQSLLALMLFLLLSIWHFGRSDAPFQGFRRGSPAIWLAGSIPIIGPMMGHPAQTGQLFAWLLGYEAGAVIAAVGFLGPILLAIWTVGLTGVWLTGTSGQSRLGTLELLALAAAMILLPPIIAFTFYFCVVHSTRHFLEILATSQPVTRSVPAWRFLVRQAAPATLAAIALGAIAWWFLGTGRELPGMTSDGIRVLFWGLAALTVPHVLVVERWWAPVHGDGPEGSTPHS